MQQQKALIALSNAAAAADLIAATAKAILANSLNPIPGAGLAIATATVAGMLALFANIKAQVADIQQFESGTTTVLGGKRHRDGGVYVPGLGEAEQGERVSIFSRNATRKFSGLEALTMGINSGSPALIREGLMSIATAANMPIMPSFAKGNQSINVTTNPVFDDKGYLKKINDGIRSHDWQVTQHDGYKIMRKGNITRKVMN